jgi:hypothetical protein
VQTFFALYGIRRFTTAFTRPKYLSLFWTSRILSTLLHTAPITSFLILHSYMNLQLPGGLFPLGFTIKSLKVLVFFTFVMYFQPRFPKFHHSQNILLKVQNTKYFVKHFSPPTTYFLFLASKPFPQYRVLEHSQPISFPLTL